jgi:hypothetical protein
MAECKAFVPRGSVAPNCNLAQTWKTIAWAGCRAVNFSEEHIQRAEDRRFASTVRASSANDLKFLMRMDSIFMIAGPPAQLGRNMKIGCT